MSKLEKALKKKSDKEITNYVTNSFYKQFRRRDIWDIYSILMTYSTMLDCNDDIDEDRINFLIDKLERILNEK